MTLRQQFAPAGKCQPRAVRSPRKQGVRMFIAASIAIASSGCAANPAPTLAGHQPVIAETIAISVGPCFGFCPVYSAKVSPDGTVSYAGTRHTALLGERQRAAGVGIYRAIAADLSLYRPADGTTTRVGCDSAISDTSMYEITWTDPSGRQTVATHKRGCQSGAGKALDTVLEALPARLGISTWSKQTTRPGEPRG